tara:strand:- start:1439 stop:2335 length:897 start_codon:yes stop_codon:yes gene_type:complete
VEQQKQNINAFHLAGIVPVAGQSLDFNFPWHDCLQPIAQNYLAVERAVWECACAGCETIWVVCHDDMQPLIRYRLGDYVQDPKFTDKNRLRMPDQVLRPIPIYYVPIHPKDKDKRDCLGWSVLHGALTAYWLSKTISKWVVPDKYYTAFPYGIYDPAELLKVRKKVSNKKPFYVSHGGKTVKDNCYLGFTFDAADFKSCRRTLRREATGEWESYDAATRIPLEKRWSARYFPLDKIFQSVNMEEGYALETTWYYDIDSWGGLRRFLASDAAQALKRPSEAHLGYHEWNPIGVDNESED